MKSSRRDEFIRTDSRIFQFLKKKVMGTSIFDLSYVFQLDGIRHAKILIRYAKTMPLIRHAKINYPEPCRGKKSLIRVTLKIY